MNSDRRLIIKRKKGFTLIELLVVIAIISLLMSILMPALKKVNLLAKAVICRSNLHQWAIYFSLYTSDNQGYFVEGTHGGGASGVGGVMWMDKLEPYHKRDYKLFCCPMATKPWTEGGRFPFAAWGKFGDGERFKGTFTYGDYGSYGMNGWLCNPPQGVDQMWTHPTTNNWRNANVRGAGNIPMFLGCSWPNGRPEPYHSPPEYDGHPGATPQEVMRRFVMNRHNGYVNGAFLNWSVRKIGLKELWKLKWHRDYNTQGPWTPVGGVLPDDWPVWMQKFKDYD